MGAAAENVALPFKPDAILFSYTHDILRSRKALENLFSQASSGTRVSVTGTKLYAKWLIPANVYLRYSHRAYITNFDGLEHPWSVLAEYLDDFRVAAGASRGRRPSTPRRGVRSASCSSSRPRAATSGAPAAP